MNLRPHLFALATATVIGGCSTFSDRQKTIGSLDRADWPTVPQQETVHNRTAAMEHYQAFLDESPENVFVPEAMRRLADLNLELEQEALIEGKQPAAGESRAAQLYAELLEKFPEHPRNDSALYQLARAHEQSSDPEPAMQALTSYADRYSNGDKYDEAQFRRGEYLFVRRQYAAAEQAYQSVLEQGEASTYHQQALYKIGWARFKQNHYRQALNAYTRLLDETIEHHNSSKMPETLDNAGQERLNDTLRAVSLSFSYLGGTEEISNYFRASGNRSYEPLIYASLASLHMSKERYTDAAETYRLFASVHTQHREAPLFQSRVIDVYKKAGFGARVLEEKQAFVERYQPASDYWLQHDPQQSSDVLGQVQRHLQDIAQHYHAQAQQKKTPATYADAGRWYRLYLSSFRESKQAPYMNFLYAELLTDAKQYGEAARQYELTAYEYGKHEKAAEAGYASLLAYQKHETTLKGSTRSRWHRAGITGALRFSEAFPEHKQALPVRTRAAQQLYALKEYREASAAAQPVVENPAAPKDLQLSNWVVIAHSQFDLEDYHRAEAAYQQVLARTPAADKQRPALEEKLAASIYKQGEQARDAGELAVAADHFLRLAVAVPGSSINVTAQYDAAAAYIALKQWPQAIAVLQKWRISYPKNKLQADVTRKLAVLYRENGQPLQSAGEFERIAATEKDPALKREASWTTASLYQEAGRNTQSIEAYKRFVKQFLKPVEQSMEARHQLVMLHEKAGQPDKQRYWQQQIVKTDRNAGKERSDRTRFLAAYASLALTEPDYQAYKQVHLKEPLKKNLARKKKFMQAAIKGYSDVAAYKVAGVTTQATFRIGEIYNDFGQALMTSERPGNLNAEELEQYEIMLEEQAYPFEEKSIEVHEANAQRTTGGLYDKWVRKSMASLATLMPVRYAKEEKGEDFVLVLQ